MNAVKAPGGLNEAGRKLWRSVAGKYALRADELRVLEDACRLTDVIADLEAAMVDQPMLSKGSYGQPVINPLLSEQRTTRSTVSRLLAQLKLPDDPTVAGESAPNQQRAAAQTRWASAHGKTS